MLRRDESFTHYLGCLNDYEKPTTEESEELIVRAQSGDQKALDRLVGGNLRLVIHVANRYKHLSVPFDDLVSAGNVGLVRAIKKHDPQRGTKFITTAYFWVRNEILKELYSGNSSSIVQVPESARLIEKKYSDAIQRIYGSAIIFPDDTDMSSHTDLTPLQIDIAKAVRRLQFTRDEGSGDDGVYEYLASKELDPSEDVMCRLDTEESVQKVLSYLNVFERDVIKARFGLDDGIEHTLVEVSRKFGCSRQYIDRIENQALRRMRAALCNSYQDFCCES